MRKKNILFIYSNGRVAALNKKDGQIIWEIKLKQYVGSSMTYAVGQIYVEEENVYVAVSGILICLAAKDGSLKWKNELKGWGYSFVSMAGIDSTAAAASVQATASTAAAT